MSEHGALGALDALTHVVLPWASLLVVAPLTWAWRLSLQLARLESEAARHRELVESHKAWTADVSAKVDRLAEAVARIEGHLSQPAAARQP